MSTVITWKHPDFPLTTFTTGETVVNRLIGVEGLEPVVINPTAIKSPNQPGDTVVDVVVPGRVITVTGLIQVENYGSGEDAIWDARRALARVLSQQPNRLNEDYAPGLLTITRPEQSPVEINAVPLSSTFERPRGSVHTLIPFEAEFYCPSPYFRDTTPTVVAFTAAGGFEWSLEFGLEMTSNNVEIEIDYAGDVDSPILATITGDVTTARMKNITHSETLEIEGNLPATKQWVINTQFGQKAVDEVTIADGSTVSALSKIDLTKADFWGLRPGVQTVTFEADVNTSGSASLQYRNYYSGI